MQTVALLCNAFGDPYSLSTLRSALDALSQAGLGALAFCGGYPQAPMFRDAHGELAVPDLADGLIILSATLRSSDANLARLVSRTRSAVVTLGDAVAGAANIGLNDEAAVFQCVAHLVKRHACKRIAYIAGPDESVDSERRLGAYRMALTHFGLPRESLLVARGDFEASSGREAALQLLSNGSFDAIVAANDLMAIGAIEALSAAGIAVPDRVKVIGFDGIEESRFAWGGLTTVRQPVSEQGIAAAEAMRKLLSGKDPEDTGRLALISASLLIRHTCGCGSDADRPAPRAARSSDPVAGEELALIDDALRETIRRQLATKRLQRELARMAGPLLGVRDYRDLASVMTDVVRLYDISRFVLCAYTSDSRFARVILESRGRDVIFRPEADTLPVTELLRHQVSRRQRLAGIFIEPLELAEEHFGFLVIEGGLGFGAVQLELRSLIAAAMSRLGMLGEIRRIYSEHRKLRTPLRVPVTRPEVAMPEVPSEGPRDSERSKEAGGSNPHST